MIRLNLQSSQINQSANFINSRVMKATRVRSKVSGTTTTKPALTLSQPETRSSSTETIQKHSYIIETLMKLSISSMITCGKTRLGTAQSRITKYLWTPTVPFPPSLSTQRSKLRSMLLILFQLTRPTSVVLLDICSHSTLHSGIRHAMLHILS